MAFDSMLKMNLQYFAEEEGNVGADGGQSTEPKGTEPQSNDEKAMSFDDFLKDPKNQSEFDKRLAKAIDTVRTKMSATIDEKVANARTEAEKMAKMNAEQKAKYEAEKREAEIAKRESEITKRELMATAKEQLSEIGLPLGLADVLNYTNADECAKSIEAVKGSFTEAVEKAVNDRLNGGDPPKKATSPQKTLTAADVKAMTPEQINANWDAVQQFMMAK